MLVSEPIPRFSKELKGLLLDEGSSSPKYLPKFLNVALGDIIPADVNITKPRVSNRD